MAQWVDAGRAPVALAMARPWTPLDAYRSNRRLSGMKASDLTTEQAGAIKDRIAPMLAYLHRLKARMDERDFLANDPLYVLVTDARESLHSLWVESHYLSCSGVGRRSG